MYKIIFAETSIFTLPGITLHKDPGLRSSGLSSSGRHKAGTYHAFSRMLINKGPFTLSERENDTTSLKLSTVDF